MERIVSVMVNDVKVILYHSSDEVYMVPQTGYISNPPPTYISEMSYDEDQLVDSNDYSEVLTKMDIISILENYI
jgi:hypothetical protein